MLRTCNYLLIIYLVFQDGGFYSAEDADSLATKTSTEKKEGAFYVWEKHEIEEILGDTKLSNGQLVSKLFSVRYGVKPDGNVDPYQVKIKSRMQFEMSVAYSYYFSRPHFIRKYKI